MPRKKSNIGRSTRNAKYLATKRASETPQQQKTRLELNRHRALSLRANETDSQRNVRVTDLRSRASSSRAAEKPDQRAQRLDNQRLRQTQLRTKTDLKKAAFNDDKKYDYKMHPNVVIGSVKIVCPYRHTKKLKRNPTGSSCSDGKVQLPPLVETPETLPYISESTKESQESKHSSMC